MGVCLVLHRLSDAAAERIRADPPLVWILLQEPDLYREAKRPKLGAIGRLLGKSPPPEPEAPAFESLGSEAEPPCDLDKAWHAIHFLLTGSEAHSASPLSFLAETGAHLCDIEVGYGPPEHRGAAAVRAFARALAGISRSDLEARLDARELNSRKIYPGHWTGDEADRGYVGAHFEALVEFVSDAAAAGQGVLLQFT